MSAYRDALYQAIENTILNRGADTDALVDSVIEFLREHSPIKPLEWNGAEGAPGRDIHATPDGLHRYTVRHLSDGLFDVILNNGTPDGAIWFRQLHQIEHTSYADAKAFCETHFKARTEPLLQAELQTEAPMPPGLRF